MANLLLATVNFEPCDEEKKHFSMLMRRYGIV